MDADEAALAIVRVQVAEMVIGIRAVSVERGWDPRNFALLPFGGAGSLYAGLIVEDLGIERIFVPTEPGVLSALGMLLTDVKYTDVVTRLMDTNTASAAALDRIYESLERNLGRELDGEGLGADAVRFERSCDMRYRGQAYEINVPVPGVAAHGRVAAMTGAFHALHRSLYGQAAEGDPVEFVNYRVTAIGEIRKPELRRRDGGARPGRAQWRSTGLFPSASAGSGRRCSHGPTWRPEPGSRARPWSRSRGPPSSSFPATACMSTTSAIMTVRAGPRAHERRAGT